MGDVAIRLAAREKLDKKDVESVYAGLVKVIGGTYYEDGAGQTAPGRLGAHNFSLTAGITNAHKAQPNGVYTVQITWASPLPIREAVSLYAPMPDYAFSGKVVYWALAGRGSSIRTYAASAQLVRANGSTAWIGNLPQPMLAVEGGLIYSQNTSGGPLGPLVEPRDRLNLIYEADAGSDILALQLTVSVKAAHVR